MANLAQLIKQAAMDAVNASKPSQVVFGVVVGVSPLSVKLSEKLILTKDVLIVPEHLTDHDVVLEINSIKTTYKYLNALKAGDKVVMVRNQGGQQYYILDKVVNT